MRSAFSTSMLYSLATHLMTPYSKHSFLLTLMEELKGWLLHGVLAIVMPFIAADCNKEWPCPCKSFPLCEEYMWPHLGNHTRDHTHSRSLIIIESLDLAFCDREWSGEASRSRQWLASSFAIIHDHEWSGVRATVNEFAEARIRRYFSCASPSGSCLRMLRTWAYDLAYKMTLLNGKIFDAHWYLSSLRPPI